MPDTAPQAFSPDWTMHPGVYLRALLEEHGIRQAELAERTGLKPTHIKQIINESTSVSADVALLLDRALGTHTGFWTRSAVGHQTRASQEMARQELSEVIPWLRKFDTVTLRRYGIVSATDDDSNQVEKIFRFFGVASLDAFNRTWVQPRVSFRRSQSFTVTNPNTALWLRLVDRNAEQVTAPPLRPAAVRKVARTIRAMTNHTVPHGFAVARGALAEAGVILTFVREVPSTRVSGVTWWQGPKRPVIALTDRYRKPDLFWHNLLHQIGHILLHPRRTTFLDLEVENEISDGVEREAHDFAANTLLPEEAHAPIAAAVTLEDLLRLATRFGVGISVVAGQYGRATDKWGLASSLRGTISDDDIWELERISNAGSPFASRPLCV